MNPILPPHATLCLLTDIPDGGGHLLWFDGVTPLPAYAKGAFGLVLLRSGAQVFGYVNRCAHFGVPLAQKQEHLRLVPGQAVRCNVHAAHYDWAEGHCVSGECAGEGLLHVPVQVGADGWIRTAAQP